MPKEIIYPEHMGTDENPSPWPIVVWGREGAFVQVAVVAVDGMKLEPSVGPDGNGWYATLNRTGINRMIRVLRRARDQAYGKDE